MHEPASSGPRQSCLSTDRIDQSNQSLTMDVCLDARQFELMHRADKSQIGFSPCFVTEDLGSPNSPQALSRLQAEHKAKLTIWRPWFSMTA